MIHYSMRIFAIIITSILITLYYAPPIQALSPPPIDTDLLPAPAPPAPPQATRQQQPCTTAPPLQSTPFPLPKNIIDAPLTWQLTRGHHQRIAVIDTGITPHQDLPTIIAGGDYVSTGDGRQDCDGHGTLVAGIITATINLFNNEDSQDYLSDITLISIRQSSMKFGPEKPSQTPSTPGFGTVMTLAMAVRTAADMGASVINISSVACTITSLDDRALGAALAYAVDVKDSVIVTAAGNVGANSHCPMQNTTAKPLVIVSPAWYDDYVLTVGAAAADGTASAFSLHSPWVDIAAPGEIITGTTEPITLSGTSYATPIVSGVAALVRSRFPNLTARQVMSRIENTAHPPPAGWNSALGHGIIDMIAALSDNVTRQPEALSAPQTIPIPQPAITSSFTEKRIALRGTAFCVIAMGVVMCASLLWRRHQRRIAAHRTTTTGTATTGTTTTEGIVSN